MSKRKISCEIIKDLVPSYIDGVLSKESEELVRDHVEDCKDCQKMLEDMKVDITAWQDEDVSLFKKVGKSFRKMYFLKALIVILAVVGLCLLWIGITYRVIDECRPIWPKSSVEGLQENLHIVEINGSYYVHQEDIYAMGEVYTLDYDYAETGVYNFYLGEYGIQTTMPGVNAYHLNEQYQFLCYTDGVKQINYCKPDGTVVFTIWEEGQEMPSLVEQ